MPKRIGPEARIISLFTALPDDSKRIVMDIIKSQQVKKTAPKSSAPSAGRKSSRSADQKESTASTEAATVSASSVTTTNEARYVPVCAVCNNEETHADHQPDSPEYHVFRTELKKKAAA